MQKDVIYIDVEDDITAIIGKVKAAKEKIVALVPPKRIGVLQSAVNLRLLARMAETNDKRLVLITNNQALIALSAASKIPVAKNLQTKPEIAEIAALKVDDGEDIIDGAQLPVGELARTVDASASSAVDSVVDDIAKQAAPAGTVTATRQPLAKASKAKVPNFDKFRKKLFLIITSIVLLIGFFIWAIFFAPHATIVIAAKTSGLSIDEQVTLDPLAKTDFTTNKLQTVVKTQKKTQSVDFTATGSKDVGDKATGTVTFSTDSISRIGTTIPAGTELTASNGLVYTTNASVTMTLGNSTGAPAAITAAGSGTKYNGASGSASGAPSGISASISGTTTGGTDKTITVVTADDVQKATQQLSTSDDGSVKAQLKTALGKDAVAIDLSYNVTHTDPVSAPAVGQEIDSGKAKLTSDTTYTLMGVMKSELNTYLDAAVATALKNQSNQRSYDNGAKSVSFTQFATNDNVSTVKLSATAQIGPKIDDSKVKQQAEGKRYGDVQAELEAIQGVSGVDVKFSPFWVTTVPKDPGKITVQFDLQHDS